MVHAEPTATQAAVSNTASTTPRPSGYVLGHLNLKTHVSILVIGDDNVQQWPPMDSRFYLLHLRDLGLEDIPHIIDQLRPQLQHVRAIVIVAGSKNVFDKTMTCGLTKKHVSDMFRADDRIHFTALAEFEDADYNAASSITYINRTARQLQRNRLICINSSAAADTSNLKRLIYGQKTGQSYYDSVAAFFSKIPIP